jgi:N-acetylneuraminic acid mutarotase
LTSFFLCAFAGTARAHFLWLKTDSADGRPQAVLIFGESAADEAYHLPEALADTEIHCRTPDGGRAVLKSQTVDNDDRVGLVARFDAKQPCALEATREYGIYGDFLLTYYAKHVHALDNDSLGQVGPSSEFVLDLVPQATRDGLEITALWQGKPRADVELSVKLDGENEDTEATKHKTDADGKVRLKSEHSGLISVLANVYDKTKSGELAGKKYTSAGHFTTLTFPWRKESATTTSQSGPHSALPPLPEAVSSFGAAVSEGWLYVYSGHTGTEHDHSAANLSRHFRRMRLTGGGPWEDLPMEIPLQGLALVAHGGKLYRIGGMNARNVTTEDEEDLHSTDEFAAYDPATEKWTALAPLPDPRSSHNAVVIGDRVYVTGGWILAGTGEGKWLDNSLVYDFMNPSAGWQRLPEQSFQRRALAAAQWQGKLIALGGMDENADVSQRVDLFDPQTDRWSKGPDLPGKGMAGFGVSAWNLDGSVYVSGFNGRMFRLTDDGSNWEEVARLARPRFFHQIVPAAVEDTLLVVGGASRKGHLADIEPVDVSTKAVKDYSLNKSSDRAAADTRSPDHGHADES